MISTRISIPTGEEEQVSGVIAAPEDHRPGTGTGIIIAHGAGNDMETPLIVSFARELAAAGFVTLRFNFPYKEKGRKAPDPQSRLMLTWQSAYRFLKENLRYRTHMIVGCGKSMGGRIASHMAAEGLLPVSRLIFLGYPLHAAGKKEKMKDAHLYHISAPMLFFAGTRDPLCDLGCLNTVIDRIDTPVELEIIQGGNHSFDVLKSLGTPAEEVYKKIAAKATAWLCRSIT